MHAASCIAAVTGAWRLEGGGAFHNNGAIFHLDTSVIEGTDLRDPAIRMLDQSRIGAILTGDEDALRGGPPVTAMLIQNTNPVSVAPDQETVKRGFARDDLFVCVHEQFMTDTARMADVVLPATMFVEHDDFYTAGGSQYLLFGPKLIEPPGECRIEPRSDLRAGRAARRRAPGLRHDAARTDRPVVAEIRLGHARRVRSQSLDRLPAGFRHGAFSRRFRLSGRQVPFQAGLAERAVQALASDPCAAGNSQSCPTTGT